MSHETIIITDYLILQDGRVLIKKVANLLLCIYAQNSVGLGLLKAKVC